MIFAKDKRTPRLFLGCFLLYCSLLIHTGLVEGTEDRLRGGKKDPPIVSGFPGSYTPSQKDALKGAVLSIRAGYMPREGRSFDQVDNLSSGQLFDGPKLQSFMEENFTPITRLVVVASTEQSFESFTSNIEIGLQVSAKSNFLAGSFQANAATEIALSSQLQSTNVLIHQRDIFFYGYLQLPNHAFDKSDIQALMNPSVLTGLKAIDSHEEAMTFVRTYGVGYFQNSFYGGLFKMSSRLVKESWFEKSDVEASFDANYKSFKGDSVGGSGSSRVTVEKGSKSTSFMVTHKVLGGDFTKIRDDLAWKESVKDSPAISDYSIIPLYELLSSTGDANEQSARSFLQNAVATYMTEYKINIPGYDPPTISWINLNWDSGTWHHTDRFSEEHGGYSQNVPGPIYAFDCYTGSYCDNKRFAYRVFDNRNLFREAGSWTGWFSEEQGPMICPNGKAVRQIQCSGSHCDNMRLKCAGLIDGYRIADHYQSTSSWFSEENSWHYCSPRSDLNQGKSHYVVGLSCSGKRCDNLRLHCKLFEKRVIGTVGDEEGEFAPLEALHEGEDDEIVALKA